MSYQETVAGLLWLFAIAVRNFDQVPPENRTTENFLQVLEGYFDEAAQGMTEADRQDLRLLHAQFLRSVDQLRNRDRHLDLC